MRSDVSARDEPKTAEVNRLHSSNAVQAMRQLKMKVPGDVVNSATASLPDQQRHAIRWLYAHAGDHNLSLAEIGQLVGQSQMTISQIFWGRYEADLDPVIVAIEAFRAQHEGAKQGGKLPFIETALTKRIWQVCAAAVEFQRMAFIFGDSQVGKTTALESYAAAQAPGQTVYVRVPTGGAMSQFLPVLALALRISPQIGQRILRQRMVDALDDRMLLIVAEAHQALATQRRSTNPVEFVRELHDRCRCGVVLAGTNVFRREMEHGELSGIMQQSYRRRFCALQLDDRPSREDLDTFALANGLPASTGKARELETAMVEREALGMWLTLLRMASKLAAQRKEKTTWQHVLDAHAGLVILEKGAKNRS